MASSLEVDRQNKIVIARLNRPEKLNALNKELYDELNHLLDVLETDKTVRALILTGAGEKAFCVGADLKERHGMNEKDILLRLDFVRRLFPRLETLSIPVIAAVNGIALGGGTELALACDLRVASESAVFGLPEVSLAIIPGTGGTQRLTRLVGLSRAMEWVLLAKRVTAEEAYQFSLANVVVPSGQSLATALEWAEKMIEFGPIALQQAKRAMREGYEQDLDTALKTEIQAYKACLYSKDRLEGLNAFAEKRRPEFRGE